MNGEQGEDWETISAKGDAHKRKSSHGSKKSMHRQLSSERGTPRRKSKEISKKHEEFK